MTAELVAGIEARMGPLPPAMRGALLLLVVNVPLVPVQPELAGALSAFGAVNLAVLLSARGRLEAR